MRLRLKGEEKDLKEVFSGEEILLRDLLLIFWVRKLYFVPIGLFFFFLSYISNKTTPLEYVASQTLFHENSQGSSSTVSGGLSELLGIDQEKNVSTSSLSDPSFYPTILQSRGFLLELINEKFYSRPKKDSITLKEFLTSHDDRNWILRKTDQVLSIPSKIIRVFKSNEIRSQQPETRSDGLRRIDPSDLAATTMISGRISLSIGGNLITLETKMPDPIVATQLNLVVFEKLIEHAEKYETETERVNIEYLELRKAFAEEKYNESKAELASYIDSHLGLATQQSRIFQEQLASKNSIDAGIYREVASELEKQKFAYHEKKPVYSVFEPVFVPNAPNSESSGGLLKYAILTMIFGLFLISVEVIIRLMNG